MQYVNDVFSYNFFARRLADDKDLMALPLKKRKKAFSLSFSTLHISSSASNLLLNFVEGKVNFMFSFEIIFYMYKNFKDGFGKWHKWYSMLVRVERVMYLL